MSKQSDKRDEIFYILQDVRLGNLSEYEAALKLQEAGVVIRVGEDEVEVVDSFGASYKTKIVATEPLVKDD